MIQTACVPAKVEGSWVQDHLKKKDVETRSITDYSIKEILHNKELAKLFGSVLTVGVLMLIFSGYALCRFCSTPATISQKDVGRIVSGTLRNINRELARYNLKLIEEENSRYTGVNLYAISRNQDQEDCTNDVIIQDPTPFASLVKQTYPYQAPDDDD
jgi:hypothetical protein